MNPGATIVVDVGKSLTKLSLWDETGRQLARLTRPNQPVSTSSYIALDAHGIDGWLMDSLAQFATSTRVARIVPVSHGAAAALVRDGKLAAPPIDYENAVPRDVRMLYDAERDAFLDSGSPALPLGLNLGVQLAWLQGLRPDLFSAGTTILPWAQYWAWRLSGVAATELTSLGCHTDLWRPLEGGYTDLAARRGWRELFAPVRKASDVLGVITSDIARQTGLPANTVVHCGLHDSNAALLAARGFNEVSQKESCVLSTGTWFVAMRSPEKVDDVRAEELPEARDCLINVDAYGMPIPSSRFMGGREIELLSGIDARWVDIVPDQPALIAAVPDVVAAGTFILPTFTPNVGPFPNGRGAWLNEPVADYTRRAAVCLYAALMANASLDLIGARERLLVEGRFAEAEVFVRALASLRPNDQVFVSNAHQDVSYGALRLLNPALNFPSRLTPVRPLDIDIQPYAAKWRAMAADWSGVAT